MFEPAAPGEPDANAFEVCEPADEEKCTHNVAATIKLSGSLQDAKKFLTAENQPISPFHVLYADNDQENDDQFVMTCPPTINPVNAAVPWEQALERGCEGQYNVNAKGPSGTCASEKELGNHECVGLVATDESKTNFKGATEGKRAEELTVAFQSSVAHRVENGVNGTKFECPNKWQNDNGGGVPIIKANDSRLVQFFVVPFTVTDFERKGEVSPLVPITNFATFYVTGWGAGNVNAGQGSGVFWNPKERRDGCSEKLFNKPSGSWHIFNKEGKEESVGPLTAAERTELENEAIPLKTREQKEKEKGFDDDVEQPREVVGHLIKYVNVLGEGSGNVTCKQESFETCEEHLTE